MFFQKSVIMVLFSLFLVSCGGSGGGGTTTTNTPPPTQNFGVDGSVGNMSGVLLDDFIAGVAYESTSFSGTTDASGDFDCKSGETVTFKVGTLVLGNTPCLPVVTPIDLLTNGEHKWNSVSFTGNSVDELTSAQNKKLQRMLMILQTLDTDGDLSNGISVHANTNASLTALNVTQSVFDSLMSSNSDSEFSDAMDSLVATLGGGAVAVTDVSNAMTHFKNTLSSTTECTTGDKAGSTSVMGSTTKCVATACSGSYTLQNGSCIAKTACTTGDVSNSSSVTGFVEDGCSATACSVGYGLSGGMCVAMTACTTADVANSATVSGFVDNNSCQATSCSVGYSVQGGACAVSTASQVVADAIESYETTNSVDFVSEFMAFPECTSVTSFESMRTLYDDRAINSFFTAPAYADEHSCLDRMTLALVVEARVILSREADVLELTSAPDTSASHFTSNGTINQWEEVVVGKIFDAIP